MDGARVYRLLARPRHDLSMLHIPLPQWATWGARIGRMHSFGVVVSDA